MLIKSICIMMHELNILLYVQILCRFPCVISLITFVFVLFVVHVMLVTHCIVSTKTHLYELPHALNPTDACLHVQTDFVILLSNSRNLYLYTYNQFPELFYVNLIPVHFANMYTQLHFIINLISCLAHCIH